MSPDEPKPGTWAAITRSTEAEFQSFRKGLDNLLLTPERFNAFLLTTMQKKDEQMADPQWNIKPRLVKCPNCEKEKITAIAGPKCDVCGYSMITVLKK